MKSRHHIPAAACLAVMLTSLFWPGTAAAQYPYAQPLFMAPSVQTNFYGAFYVTGGVRVRNIQTVRINVVPHTPTFVNPGVPAWGPNEPGIVLYPYSTAAVPPQPTANPADPPSISGIWVYDDGFVDPQLPTLPAGNVFIYGPNGQLVIALGHYISGVTGASIGSFNVQDPFFQTDTGGGIYNTTSTVSFTKMINGFVDISNTGTAVAGFETESRIITASPPEGPTVDFTNKIWMPYFEAGFQYSSYFDWFAGISWFTLTKSFGYTRPTEVDFFRRTFTDTYQFESSDGTNSWIGNFTSAFGGVSPQNPDPLQSYVIFPIGRAAGRDRPTRTFATQADSTVLPITAQEILTNSLDFSAIEFRAGGRSWIPLFGLGRFGVTLGGLTTPTPYTIVASDAVQATADVVDTSGNVLAPAGTILISEMNRQQDVAWSFGLFGGLDWEVGYNRLFLKTSLEYNWYFSNGLQYGYPIYNQVDLSGASLAFSIGGRF